MACDLIPYPLLLEEKGDDCGAAPVGPSLSFRRGTEGEVAVPKHPQSCEMWLQRLDLSYRAANSAVARNRGAFRTFVALSNA